jgi:methylated-DNA-[protein]-cysteine S-methyltransferase
MTPALDIERALRDAASALQSTTPPGFAERASSAGLLDVAYGTLDSPLGTLLLASTSRGLVRVAYANGDTDSVLEQLAATVSPRLLAAPRELDSPRRELDQYFAGRRQHFEIALDWSLSRGFSRRVLEAAVRIPYGSVSTYAGVAAEAGSPRASRAAGSALGANPLPIVVPCHRVLRSGGGLGGYTGGIERKRTLLALEQGQGV